MFNLESDIQLSITLKIKMQIAFFKLICQKKKG